MPLSPSEITETGHFLGRLQHDDGALPWFRGGQWDAWNHTEALMGLTIAGVVSRETDEKAAFLQSARRGLDHLRTTQRSDGSWPMLIEDGVVIHDEGDTNQCAYPAVGVWHYALATGDMSVIDEYFPMVQQALAYVLRAQRPTGEIAWAINSKGKLGDHALLTGCASILQSLWCAARMAKYLSFDASDWLKAANQLAGAIRTNPSLFAPRERYSMDWFYPILGGALRGHDAIMHLEARAAEFVWPHYGVRCVSDRPWVTGGETAELAMALACVDRFAQARRVLTDIQHLRAPGGGYWTGYVVDDDAHWPQEQTGWTAGAILLATDAVEGLTPAANFFHSMNWPPLSTDSRESTHLDKGVSMNTPSSHSLPPAIPSDVFEAFSSTTGFMPDDEGRALFAAACDARPGTWLEIGTYCGKSTVLLAQAARAVGKTQLVTVDHHHGSEENQPGWEWHDTSMVDPDSGLLDTLPTFRKTMDRYVSDVTSAVVAKTEQVAAWWAKPIELLFLDGNHVEEMAQHDYAAFAPHITPGGLLAVHDVFPNPADGGQAPWHVVERALSEGFSEVMAAGSLRVLRRDSLR